MKNAISHEDYLKKVAEAKKPSKYDSKSKDSKKKEEKPAEELIDYS